MTQDPRPHLRSAVTRAMKARDRVGANALRSLVAAIDNAEAVPSPAPDGEDRPPASQGPIAGAVTGLGSTDVDRRHLDPEEIAAIVTAELDDLRSNATAYRSAGQDERADELEAGAATIEAVISIADASALVGAAQRIVVLTGAGISTDSGIPDFRGPNGLWTRNPDAEKLSSIEHYVADPKIRRRAWLGRLDHPAWTSEPNPGHEAIARLDRSHRLDLLVTQNIDGLHHLSGLDPDRIVEIHGSVREVECLGCGARGPMQETLDRVRAGEEDPPCLVCGGILKSATVSFGQSLDTRDLERAFDAAAQADLLVAVGTNLSVYPIASMVPIAAQQGTPIVIVNGSATEMDALATVVVRGSISEVLPQLVDTGP